VYVINALVTLRRIDELVDRMGGSVDVVTEAKIGLYRESRIKAVLGHPTRRALIA
jgi:hypothetical protein